MAGSDIDFYLENTEVAHSRKKLYGVGIYDVYFSSHVRAHGTMKAHRAYSVWMNILRKCYSSASSEKTVCEEWLKFSSFKEWWYVSFVEGFVLDNHILGDGKEYSSNVCVYIPMKIKQMLTNSVKADSGLPRGVSIGNGKNKRYLSGISINNQRKTIGVFYTAIEAHNAWVDKKLEIAMEVKEECDMIHPRLHECLMEKIEQMREKP